MDVAYDHIQEEVLTPDEAAKQGAKQQEGTLNTELQEAYKSFSASPWGVKLGGFLGNVKKQSENYYEEARQEASAAGGEALKGFTDLRSSLVSRARSISTSQNPLPSNTWDDDEGESLPVVEGKATAKDKPRTESEALRESESIISRFRAEATKRLKDIEKAEDAADEALLKFGTNIRNFLRDAVTIAPPSEEKDKDGNSKVLFESKDQDGKRVIHTTRFDAQLHVIHSSLDSFTKDPVSPEYEKWAAEFNVEKKTEAIAADLEKHDELRRSMERLVPEKVEYESFWKRYYFLRMVVEAEETRRKELLKGAALDPTTEVTWDEESDSSPSTPQPERQQPSSIPVISSHTPSASMESSTTVLASSSPHDQPQAPNPSGSAPTDTLKPLSPRRSQDQHSQPDSDASYDLVSGATSRAPGSPKEEKEKGQRKEESDEEDWE